MQDPMTPMGPSQRFRFACNPKVPCFNACCRDLCQYLTPYDILRLKNGLRLTSDHFLARYTREVTGPETGLPVVVLKTDPSEGLACPFVGPEGCRVYADRPASCRLYPLARAVRRNRETGRTTEHFALIREPHCRGFAEGPEHTVSEWMENQRVSIYNEMNDRLMEIIALKRRRHPGPLDLPTRRMFSLAFYDLDNFRRHVFENGLLDNLSVEPARLSAARTDELALLRLAGRWVAEHLLGWKGFEGSRGRGTE